MTSTPNDIFQPNDVNNIAIKEHAFYCFDVIHSKLNHKSLVPPCFDTELEYPLFVTWNTISKRTGHKSLRGCIGNFEANSIGSGLKEYAAISAFKDSRFNPITLKELHKLSCGVSLLTDFEQCENYLDWSLELHGIYIQLPNPHLYPLSSTTLPSLPLPTNLPRPSFRSISLLPKFPSPPPSIIPNPQRLKSVLNATYLPDVAKEQGWNLVEAIDSCIEKSGWRGEVTEAVRRSCRVFRYRSRKVEVTWQEWRDWKEGL